MDSYSFAIRCGTITGVLEYSTSTVQFNTDTYTIYVWYEFQVKVHCTVCMQPKYGIVQYSSTIVQWTASHPKTFWCTLKAILLP
jgi:hypothetical protein